MRHPQLLLPQKQKISRIQINQSQQLLLLSQSQSLLQPRMPFPLPHPPQKINKIIIQMQLPPIIPLPQLLLQPQLLQPQFVAVKSLIVCCLQVLFMVYCMRGSMSMFPCIYDFFTKSIVIVLKSFSANLHTICGKRLALISTYCKIRLSMGFYA